MASTYAWNRYVLQHIAVQMRPLVLHGSIVPKAFESVGRHRRVAHRMLDVLMSQIILNGPSIMSPRCEVIATGMSELVGMGDKGQSSHLAGFGHNRADSPRRQGGLSLRDEHIRRVGVGTLEFPEEA